MSKYKIMSTALKLFRQNGYERTSIRQIVDEADISLGMVNHYFTSKRLLAMEVFSMIQKFIANATYPHVDIEANPILFDAVINRVQSYFLQNGEFKQFYLDILKEGIFSDRMMQYPEQMFFRLQEKYAFSEKEDYVLLFNRYLPADIEKIIVLQKEAGEFPNISYDEIPSLVFRAALERYISAEEIDEADMNSRPIAKKIIEQLPPYPSEKFIQSYVVQMNLTEE